MRIHWNSFGKYLNLIGRVATIDSKTALIKCKQSEKYEMQIKNICQQGILNVNGHEKTTCLKTANI